jgi:hypothetical protein
MQAHTHQQSHGASPVEALAARNLQFLALIENTIDRVSGDTDHIRVMSKAVVACLESLQKANDVKLIDPEGRLCELLGKTAEMARRMYADASGAHESACGDRLLQPDDGVVEAFSELMEAVTELHACSEELRDWVEIHDALLEEPTGATYTNAADLIAALNSD